MTPRPKWRFSPAGMGLDERFGFAKDFAPHVRETLGVRPGMRVLEVGCGTGGFTRFLAWVMDGRGEVVGLDHDAALLELARKRTDSVASDEFRLRFEAGDALKLPFADGEFDAVVSQFLLCVLPSPYEALNGMRRVTRPGGLVASISCFCKSGSAPVFDGLHRSPGFDRFKALRARFMKNYREHVRNPGLGLPNGRDLDVWADYARVGLEDLRITGYMTMFAPSDARWSDDDARAYVEEQKKIQVGLLENLSEDQLCTLEANGFPRDDARELMDHARATFDWLLADVARIREGMEVIADPSVLITGRVPHA